MYNTQPSQPSAPQPPFPPSQTIQTPQPPDQPGRRPPTKKQPIDKRLYWIAGGVTVLGIGACGALLALILLIYIAQPRVPDGVRVAGLVIGGETLDTAETMLEKGYASQTLRLTDGDRAWNVPLNELGITVNVAETLKIAEKAAKNAILQPVYAIDFPQAQAKLINLSAEINIPPVNGNPPRAGKSVDIPFVLDRLRLDLAGEIADGVVELNMIEVAGQADSEAEYTGIQTQHTVAEGEELGLIAKKYNVSLSDLVTLNNIENPDLLYVGQVLTIPASGVYEPTAADAPPAPTNSGRAIVVSTENQRIYAYENGQLVRSHLVSTGTNATPTVKGDYKIQYKFLADDMSGPDYFLPQVPYTMYFYQGYAIHGTYWHNSFGRPMSHGCVNLPTDEAKWFFEFASIGTPVRVI